LRALGSFDAVVAHWIVPCAWPLLAGGHEPLEVFAHGADVRLLLALPARLRAAIVQSLLGRGACVRFAARSLRQRLLAALPSRLAQRLELGSAVRPATMDLPEVHELRADAAALRRSMGVGHGSTDHAPALVVSVGRLVKPKRVQLALQAMALLERPARLVVVGDGPERARLEAHCRELGLGASFVGGMPRPRALAWLAAADVLLHTSSEEAAPSVVREARALGTPVVCCPAGDLAAWAAADRGIILSSPDAASVAAALGCQLGGRPETSRSVEGRNAPARPPKRDPGLPLRALLGHAPILHDQAGSEG
jgi:glycosyltransferase involved in cell wall biosynthesis